MAGVPTWNVGQVLSSNDVDTWFVPRAAVTTADVSSTSAATITDPTLVLPVDSGAIYDVDFYAVFDGPGSNSALWWFTGPAGAVASLWVPSPFGAGAAFNEIVLGSGAAIAAILTTGAGVNYASVARGTLVTAGTAGNLQFVFQQNASSGTATRRRARSRLVLRRIG